MKNLLIALTLVLTATSATAATNTNVKFVTTNDSYASKWCVIAAQIGLTSATKMADDKDLYSLKCNGESIKSFSETYNPEKVAVEKSPAKSILVVPANATPESRVCAQAVKTGVRSVVGTVDFNVNGITCNGKRIDRFVAQYNKS